jgi:TPR repeat protein
MKPLPRWLLFILVAGALLGLAVWGGCTTPLINHLTAQMSDLPRYTNLPLFDPHRKTFSCVYQAKQVPPIDPQAELWYQQALALDDPNIWFKNRDWNKIYQLYVQAAERNHWKAMLNLASLILSSYPVAEHDPEVAIRWVEKTMKLGVPDAWDRMGTYHQSGLIKGGNATSAYAFFQKAADLGSPAAMTFLGYKLAGTYDDPGGEFWGNLPIGTAMLECAFTQGNGDAAEKLGFIYERPETSEAKFRALKILHEGTKLGSADCANGLASEFNGFDLTNGRNLVGYIDKARAERYAKLGDALKFWRGRLKLPNLDKVLPLPPAPLPKWDGDTQTLIDAAKAVSAAPGLKPASAASLPGRAFMPDGYGVLALTQSPYAVPGVQRVPQTGYGPSYMSKAALLPARRRIPTNARQESRAASAP